MWTCLAALLAALLLAPLLVLIAAPTAQAQAATVITVDNLDANTSQVGGWGVSSGADPFGANSFFCNSGCSFTWTPSLPQAQTYEVFVWYTGHPNRTTQVPYIVEHAGGSATVLVNQQQQAGQWVPIGSWAFDAGPTDVTITTANGQASADAIQLRVADTAAPSTPTNLGSLSVTATSAELTWSPSTDDIAVQQYRVFRNGSFIGSTSHPTTTFGDTGLSPQTAYAYRVSAVDSSGNESARSATLNVTTPVQAGVGPSTDIVINELVAANDSFFDAFGATPDWIELRNSGTTTADLTGWSIADSGSSWTFPSVTIAPGARILVFASGRDVTTPQLHTNFGLSSGGEIVTLVDAAGSLIDSYTYPALGDDVAYGLGSDGDDLGVLVSPTPLTSNTALAPSQVTVATQSQSFQGTLTVTLQSAIRAGETVRYTIDGSDVGANSPTYNGPFTINNSAVVRAAVVDSNGVAGPESTEAYVAIDPSLASFSSDLPVVLVHADGDILSLIHI